MRRCVALRHVPFEGLGSFAPVLRARGWETRTVDVTRPEQIPAGAATADLLVLLGGPDSVCEPPPYLEAEIALARERIDAGRATLGICLGSQVLAAALGGTVRHGPRPEIGWTSIELECDAEHDPVGAALAARTSMAFHWHGDTFDLPPGARPLARSQAYDVQGFSHGDLTWAIQFHPEITAADLPRWIDGYREELAGTPEAQPAEEMLRLAEALDGPIRDQAGRFLNALLNRIEAAEDR